MKGIFFASVYARFVPADLPSQQVEEAWSESLTYIPAYVESLKLAQEYLTALSICEFQTSFRRRRYKINTSVPEYKGKSPTRVKVEFQRQDYGEYEPQSCGSGEAPAVFKACGYHRAGTQISAADSNFFPLCSLTFSPEAVNMSAPSIHSSKDDASTMDKDEIQLVISKSGS